MSSEMLDEFHVCSRCREVLYESELVAVPTKEAQDEYLARTARCKEGGDQLMAGSQYSGSAPLEGLYALDNGGEVRFYFSESSLASAVQGGYASDASSIYKKRPASLQYFGTGGIVDLSVYIGVALPSRDPSFKSPEFVAFSNSGRMDGPRDAWDALQKAARKQEAADRKLLAKQILAYRLALQSGAPAVPHMPTFP